LDDSQRSILFAAAALHVDAWLPLSDIDNAKAEVLVNFGAVRYEPPEFRISQQGRVKVAEHIEIGVLLTDNTPAELAKKLLHMQKHLQEQALVDEALCLIGDIPSLVSALAAEIRRRQNLERFVRDMNTRVLQLENSHLTK
jgi:hypothetical protein